MGRYSAINNRKSVRKYSEDELQLGLLEEIMDAARDSERLYEHIDMETHLAEDGRRVQEASTSISRIIGRVCAPHYIIAASEKKDGYLENIGYCLERLVLKLTDMGISTCWLGGQVDKSRIVKILPMKKHLSPIIAVALGFAEYEEDEPVNVVENRDRKSLDEIVFGAEGDTWKRVFEAVRQAPSAVNGQPWRFFVDDSYIHAYITKRKNLLNRYVEDMNRIDMGIALCHLQLALENEQMECEFEKLNLAHKQGHIYITSIKYR